MISFSGLNCEYWVFSNFACFGFSLDGKYWSSTEHYYQAKKFEGLPYEEIIRNAKTPAEAKKLGKANFIRDDWDQVKEDVMRKALFAKFTSHEMLKETLLDTKEEEIIEASPWDAYWGTGHDGKGLNRLGKLLVETREKIKQQEIESLLNAERHNP